MAAGEVGSRTNQVFGGENLKRQKVLRFLLKALAALLVLGLVLVGVLFVYMQRINKSYKIEFYQLTSEKLNSNLRIVYLTDLHLHEYGDGNSELLSDIEKLAPDLILSGGDMVIYSEEDYSSMIDFTEKLSKIAPLYGVLGNHESEKIYMDGDSELVSRFEEAGMHFLRYEDTTIEINGDQIQLVGISGTSGGFTEYGGSDEMDSLEDSDCYRIVMAHVPIIFADHLVNYDFDLGLAGHTHGGLVRIPKIGGLYSSEEGFLPEYSGGLYDLSNGAKLIISRGLGDSAKIPIRVYSSHELSVIDINKY